jgi:hypothetical protein
VNAQFPQGAPPYGGGFPSPPNRGLGTGWVITLVAIGVVVVVGVAVSAFALLSGSSGSSYDKPDGKYGAAPLPSCEEIASRVGNLPPQDSDTKHEGSKSWRLCTFKDSANALSIDLDLEVNTVQRQRDGFDIGTSSGAYVLDPTVQLGERAAWGLAPSGRMCNLIVLDSNATFKVDVDSWNAARDDTQTCKNKARAIAQTLYGAMQPG